MRTRRWYKKLILCLVIGICLVGTLGMKASYGMVSMTGEPMEQSLSDTEQFTDTDRRRGTLSIRCDIFQGFHGSVFVTLYCPETDKEITCALRSESHYSFNTKVLPGTYKLTELKTETDGREFECFAGSEEVLVEEDQISVFSISVKPESVLRFLEEPASAEEMTSVPNIEPTQVSGEAEPCQEAGVDDGIQEETHAEKAPEYILMISAAVIGGLSFIWFLIMRKRLKDWR